MTQKETLQIIKKYMKEFCKEDKCTTAKSMVANIQKHYNEKISEATVSRLKKKGYHFVLSKDKTYLVFKQKQFASSFDIAYDVPYVTFYKTSDHTDDILQDIIRLAKNNSGEVFSIIRDSNKNLLIYSSVFNFSKIINDELRKPTTQKGTTTSNTVSQNNIKKS